MTDIQIHEDNDLAVFSYEGLYDHVEQNFQSRFSPFKVTLLQTQSPACAEGVEGARPGWYQVGPGDGTRPDIFVKTIDVMLLDYYAGRIMNELGLDGKPIGGVNSQRVCGSIDGVHPFFTNEQWEEYGDEDDGIAVTLSDYRTGEQIAVNPDTFCEDCPMSRWGAKDAEGNRLKPPCQPYPRVMLYLPDLGVPAQFATTAFNTVRAIEGRQRVKKGTRPIPGIRKMTYPASAGDLPPYVREDGPHAVRWSTDKVETIHGGIAWFPVLEYAEEPLTPAQFAQFRQLRDVYAESKEAYTQSLMTQVPEYEEDAVSEPASGGDVDVTKAKAVLGRGKKRRLAVDDDEL